MQLAWRFNEILISRRRYRSLSLHSDVFEIPNSSSSCNLKVVVPPLAEGGRYACFDAAKQRIIEVRC